MERIEENLPIVVVIKVNVDSIIKLEVILTLEIKMPVPWFPDREVYYEFVWMKLSIHIQEISACHDEMHPTVFFLRRL
jgi:hypothetical protein